MTGYCPPLWQARTHDQPHHLPTVRESHGRQRKESNVSEIHTYIRRPESVEATLWNGTASDATRVIDWVLANGGTARFIEGQFPYDDGEKGCPFSAPSIAVNTPSCGTSFAGAGDYVVKTPDGLFDVANPRNFRNEYKVSRP